MKSTQGKAKAARPTFPPLLVLIVMATKWNAWGLEAWALAPPSSPASFRIHNLPLSPFHSCPQSYSAWLPQGRQLFSSASHGDNTNNRNNDDANEEAARLQKKAQELRAQIRQMEDQIGQERRERYNKNSQKPNNDSDGNEEEITPNEKSLKNKRILILGANGRLGSMITRHLLRSHPEVKEVVAAVHYVGEASTRGYGRLSYEVGAEDGIGSIGAAWSSEDERNASFKYNPEVMDGYNLNKLRVVEVELLNPTQVRTITEDVDAIVYCATDFEGNRPRAIASLNAAFLFRAVSDPFKGRVEIEGVRNCLEGLMGGMREKKWRERRESAVGSMTGGGKDVSSTTSRSSFSTDPTQFVLISTDPNAFGEFETPFGEFNGLKRQGEMIVMEEFPSISYSVLQMGRFDERVEEGLQLLYEEAKDDAGNSERTMNRDYADNKRISSNIPIGTRKQRKINRRDAARAAVEALLDENLKRKKVLVYTSIR